MLFAYIFTTVYEVESPLKRKLGRRKEYIGRPQRISCASYSESKFRILSQVSDRRRIVGRMHPISSSGVVDVASGCVAVETN